MNFKQLYQNLWNRLANVGIQPHSKGEGSRGGKVIGHTSSGKPIYDSANHPAHKNFTKQDHFDAALKHRSNEQLHNADALRFENAGNIEKRNKLREKSLHHRKQEAEHNNMAKRVS